MPKFEAAEFGAAKTQFENTSIDEISEIKAKRIKRKPRKFSEKYSKGKQVGKGPFGHVYNCWVRDDMLADVGGGDADTEDNGLVEKSGEKRPLTLKILKKNLLSQKPILDDLLNTQFKVLMDARHPNIIRMFDIFQDRQNFFVVQEFLKGQDLYYALNSGVIFSEEQAQKIIRQTC